MVNKKLKSRVILAVDLTVNKIDPDYVLNSDYINLGPALKLSDRFDEQECSEYTFNLLSAVHFERSDGNPFAFSGNNSGTGT